MDAANYQLPLQSKRQLSYSSSDSGGHRHTSNSDTVLEIWNRLGALATEFDSYYVSIKCFQSILKLTQYNAESLINLSKCCDKFENASTGYENTLQTINYLVQFLSSKLVSKHHVHQITFSLANLYHKVEQYQDSLRVLEGLDDSLVDFEVLYLTGLNHYKLNNHSKLEKSVNDCLALNLTTPQAFKIQLLMAKTCFYHNNYDEALQYLEKAREFDRFNEESYYYLILILFNQKNIELATAVSNQALVFSPTSYNLILLNSYLNGSTLPELAQKNLNYLITLNEAKNDFLPWFLLSFSYFNSHDFKNSFNCLQICLQKSSKLSLVWLLIGHLYLNLNQLPDALSAYSQALRLQHDEFNLGSGLAWDGLSCVYQRCENQIGDSVDACERSLMCFTSVGDKTTAKTLEDNIKYLKLNVDNPANLQIREPIELPDSLIISYINQDLSDRIKLSDNYESIASKLQESSQEAPKQREVWNKSSVPVSSLYSPAYNQPGISHLQNPPVDPPAPSNGAEAPRPPNGYINILNTPANGHRTVPNGHNGHIAHSNGHAGPSNGTPVVAHAHYVSYPPPPGVVVAPNPFPQQIPPGPSYPHQTYNPPLTAVEQSSSPPRHGYYVPVPPPQQYYTHPQNYPYWGQ